MAKTGNVVPTIVKAEHIGPDDTGDNIEAKRVANYVWDGVSSWERMTQSGGSSTTIGDGTNSPVHILKSDGTAAGQNGLMIAGAYQSVTYTTTTVQAVASTDAGGYNYVSVHQTSSGTSSVSNFQVSNDNTNWVSLVLYQPSNTLSSGSTSTSSGAIIFSGPLPARYFRINVTGISAGTTAGTVVFSTNHTTNAVNIAGQIAINGTQATNVAQIAGTTAAVNTGSASNGTLRVVLATDQPALTNAQPVTTSVPSTTYAFVTTVTTAGNRVQLASNTLINGGILQAPSTNAGIVYVGVSTVSSSVFGAELQPGQSVGWSGTNTSQIYIDSASNGDKVAFLGG